MRTSNLSGRPTPTLVFHRRFDRLKDIALDYAFALRALGLEHVKPAKAGAPTA